MAAAEDEGGGGEKRVSTEEEICLRLFKERGVNWVGFLRWSLIGRERCYCFGCLFVFVFFDCVTTHLKSRWRTFLCPLGSGG